MSITTSRRIAAHYIYYRRSLLKNPILSLSSDGVVTGIEQCEQPDNCEGVEFYPGIIIPGMVNAHCHLELSYLKGQISEKSGFIGFASGLRGVRNKFTEAEKINAVKLADSTLWQAGVSAVGDISNGTSTFDVKQESHIYYRSFLELFGLSTMSAAPLSDVAAKAAENNLIWSITPHSAYSLNEKPFADAVTGFSNQTNGANTPLSIHFMESESEGKLFVKQGEMYDWYEQQGMPTDFLHYGSAAERIIRQVPAEKNIMLIHNCFVPEEIVDKIESHFTGEVTWVLCPRSNRFISGIEPPYQMLRRKGVRIAIGTDSLASNWSLDMIEELKSFKNTPLTELLGWAIDNGAEALNIDTELGGFEIGKRCGAVMLTGIDWDTMTLTPTSKATRIV